MIRLQQRAHAFIWPVLTLALVVLTIGALLNRDPLITAPRPGGPPVALDELQPAEAG